MRADIEKCFELYCEVHDLALDWLIKSWELKGEDREIARLYYQKASKERARLAKKLHELAIQPAKKEGEN